MGRSSSRAPTGLSRVSQISGGARYREWPVWLGRLQGTVQGGREQCSPHYTTWGSSPRKTEQGAGSRSSTEQGTGRSPHGTKQGSPHASVYEE